MSTILSTQVPEVTIREATPLDVERLRQLAERDSAPIPEGPLMVGEVEGEIRAAVSMTSGATIADPFHRTADVIALIYARTDQLRRRRRRVRVAARTPAPAATSPALRSAA